MARSLESLLRKLNTAEGRAIAVSLLINKVNVSIPTEIVESVIDDYTRHRMFAGAEEIAEKTGLSKFYTGTVQYYKMFNNVQPTERAVNEQDLVVLREVLKRACA